jgi:hypothetical protein
MEEYQDPNILSSLGNLMNSPGANEASPGIKSPNEFEQFFQNLLFDKLDEVMGRKIMEASGDGRTVNPREIMEQHKPIKPDGICQRETENGMVILPHPYLITQNNGQDGHSSQTQMPTRSRSKSLPSVIKEIKGPLDNMYGYSPKRRNSHLESEKRRRIYMKDSYDKLASLLPPGQFRRHSKANILNGTCDYLLTLKTKCQELESINENLKCNTLHSN